MSQLASNVGRPNYPELLRQERIRYNNTRGFDPLPSPKSGPVLDPESGMRIGLTPEIYYAMVQKEEENRRVGVAEKFAKVAPQLYPFEVDIYETWLKSRSAPVTQEKAIQKGKQPVWLQKKSTPIS